MSAPVDVLAVLRAYDRQHGEPEDFGAAIDAVAELIEAVSDVYGSHFESDNAADDPCSQGCMSCRIQAALARVGAA